MLLCPTILLLLLSGPQTDPQPVRWPSDHHNSDMFLHVVLLSLAVTLPVSARKLQTHLTCFRSSDPAAVDATQLHGNHDDQRFLWTKDPDAAPLPRCSSSSFSPPASRCEVCHLRLVFIICADLPDGAALYLERPGTPYRTEASACPAPPAAAAAPAAAATAAAPAAAATAAAAAAAAAAERHSGENTRNHFAAVASLILLILIILTAVALCRAHGSQQDGSGGTAEPPHDLEMVLSNQCGTENGQLNVSNGP